MANVIAIAAGAGFSLALESNGTVWAWGYGVYGQIGNGSTSTVSSPVQAINLAALNSAKCLLAGVLSTHGG